MDEKIDKAISELLTHFRPGVAPKPDESLKVTQAVLNLAHARQLLISKK